jgi:hypothetical protein
VSGTVTFKWTGSDADGVIDHWESIYGAEQPVRHARDDTVRTIGPLTSGKHDFLVRAIDDAGAVSTAGGLFTVFSNFDPVCRVDSTTIRSSLGITWLDPDPGVDSVLVIVHDLTQPGAQDTIPYGATVSFCWECTDKDGPVVSHDWLAGFVSSRTADLCADTDSVCAFDPDSGYVICRPEPLGPEGTVAVLQVKGRDVYGRSQGRGFPVVLQLNYPPSVTIDPPTGVLHSTVAVQFTFQGSDLDSNPAELRYRWWFDSEIPPGSFTAFAGQPQTEFRLFSSGSHQLRVQAVDQSGTERVSAPSVLHFDVFP